MICHHNFAPGAMLGFGASTAVGLIIAVHGLDFSRVGQVKLLRPNQRTERYMIDVRGTLTCSDARASWSTRRVA